ncbi:MAG: DUF4843 domain-containing protein [Marinifilaceae bacterium]
MKTNNIIIILCFLSSLMWSCQKDEVMVYTDFPKVNFDVNKMDVSNDTAYIQFGFVDTDTLIFDVHLILMGYASETAREIGLKVEGEANFMKNAIKGIDTWQMPAGKVLVHLPVAINRCNDVVGEGQELKIRLIDNDNFVSGLKDSITIFISNDIPDTWVGDAKWFMNKVEEFFGPCTKAKYLFVYQTLGVWDFTSWASWGMGDAKKFNPAKRMLNERLSEVGPIEDPDSESGYVTFP